MALPRQRRHNGSHHLIGTGGIFYATSPPPHSILARLTAASLIAALALAAPATAQVDWETVFDGEAGQVHCPPGKTHQDTAFHVISGTVLAKKADVGLKARLGLNQIRGMLPDLADQTSIPVKIAVYRGNSSTAIELIGTVTADTPLPIFTRTFSSLESNTRHAADLVVRTDNIIATVCFRTGETPADLSRPFDQYDDINHGDWASGCFAFADLNGPNHRKKVNACLCGARNASGDWARTDAGDGYEYISSPGYRTTLGCTTN